MTPLADVSRFKMYPIINKVKNAAVGDQFVKGLEKLGFGKITSINGKRSFRYSPYDRLDKENLIEKWRKLNIDINVLNPDDPSVNHENSE